MEPLDLLLTSARLLGPEAEPSPVGIRHGRFAWFGEPGESSPARQTIDLGGRVVLPGLIDGHVHFREPGAHAHKGTYATESRAAAAGGVTAVLTMPNTIPYCGTRDVLDATRAAAARGARVDYGFHFFVAGDNLDELRRVRNVPSYKLYMNETTGIESPLCDEAVLRRVLRLGHPLTAHAEGETLDFLLGCHRRWGNGPLHIVHVALAREVESLRRAKAAGQWVTAEATPHHLFLDQHDYARLGAFADMRPTLKSPSDVAAVWNGLDDQTIDTIATDHAPHLRVEKEQSPPPPGICGLQTMLPLLLDAVHAGRLSWPQLVRATSARPAEIFRLRGKGRLAIGCDADLAIVEPDTPQVIRDESQLSHPGWTPWHGVTVHGVVQMTVLRGTVIYRDGQLEGEPAGREVETTDPGAWQESRPASVFD